MKKISVLFVILAFATFGHAQKEKGKTEALEALGGSSGLLLYNTFLIVGIAADAYASDIYDAPKAAQIVGEQIGGIETVQTQLNVLLKSGFLTDPSDKTFIQELLAAFDLVLSEGEALIRYINSGSPEDAKAYDEYRTQAWAEISRLLGFED